MPTGKACQQAKHARLSSNLHQSTPERTLDSTGFSAETSISASALFIAGTIGTSILVRET